MGIAGGEDAVGPTDPRAERVDVGEVALYRRAGHGEPEGGGEVLHGAADVAGGVLHLHGFIGDDTIHHAAEHGERAGDGGAADAADAVAGLADAGDVMRVFAGAGGDAGSGAIAGGGGPFVGVDRGEGFVGAEVEADGRAPLPCHGEP